VELWEAVLRWVEVQVEKGTIKNLPDDKRRLLKDILPYIRFPIMIMEDIISKVNETKLLPSDHLLAIISYVSAKDSTSRPRFELHYSTNERNPRKPSSHFIWDTQQSTTTSTWVSRVPIVLSSDGLTLTTSGNTSSWYTAQGLVEWNPKTGVYQWELVFEQYDTTNSYNVVMGVVPATGDTSLKTTGPIAYGGQPGWGFITGIGQLTSQHSYTNSSNTLFQCRQGDRAGIRLDTDSGVVTFYRNGIAVTSGTLPRVTGAVRPAISWVGNHRMRLNFRSKLAKV